MSLCLRHSLAYTLNILFAKRRDIMIHRHNTSGEGDGKIRRGRSKQAITKRRRSKHSGTRWKKGFVFMVMTVRYVFSSPSTAVE
ncbi:CLUMA_CG009583, isoform A [Clunio marinus]|uniref:CLUMA_CG009583, isoform A n=1 Tax=Clunio marinus TaxID=568069 RepID=A0A1J1I8W0_9DIPT|nr:CLUMA_CG009583, isoform A [Clunio marinus]